MQHSCDAKFMAALVMGTDQFLLMDNAIVNCDRPNQAAAVNAPIALWFQFVHPWRRVIEQRRWAHEA